MDEGIENNENLQPISMRQMLDVDFASENTNIDGGGLLMDIDQSIFKTPLKRKQNKEYIATKQARKTREQASESDQGAENE